MHRTKTRISLLLVLLALAGLAVWRLVPTESDAGTTETSDVPTPGDGFDPHADRPENGGPAPVRAAPVELDDPMPKREVGPRLEDGTPVPVRIEYKPGTASQYVLTDAILTRNREDGAAVAERKYTGLTTEVLAGGAAPRLKVTLDWIRIQAIYPNGVEYDFDSRNPDERLLADPMVGPLVKPLLAVLGIPVQVTLGSDGSPTAIKGLDRWEEEWAAAVELLSPGQSRKMEPGFAEDDILTQWMERLFPPVGAQPLPAGEKRTLRLRRVTPYAHYVVFDGSLTSTHDAEGVFRVAATANVGKERRLGQRRGHAAAIEKVHVQADADAFSAAWRFDREAGRLIDAEVDVKYQIWPAWRRGQGPGGQSSYEARFLDVERSTRVELSEE